MTMETHPSSTPPRYDIPPPGFIGRAYTQRPAAHFSPYARQLLFDFSANATLSASYPEGVRAGHAPAAATTNTLATSTKCEL